MGGAATFKRRGPTGLAPRRGGFTLVELLVVVSITSILLSLGMSAVQQVREAARRMDCQNRLRQQVFALHHYHDAHKRFPFGDEAHGGTHHSWTTAILPYLEQSALFSQIDRKVPWDDPINLPAVHHSLQVMRCPSSLLDFEGDTDYAGIIGSALASAIATEYLNLNNGVLIRSGHNRRTPMSMANILDGTSNTMCIAELGDRLAPQHGMWADGRNAISHNNGGININNSGEIFSRHPGGAHIALTDGAVRFITESISPPLIGGLCSRAGYEDVSEVFAN